MNICDAQVTMCGSTQVTMILLAILPGAVTYVDTNYWFRKVTRLGVRQTKKRKENFHISKRTKKDLENWFHEVTI